MLETWFHFYASLKPKGKLCLRKPTSFFNELEIENELCLGMVSFLLFFRNKHPYNRGSGVTNVLLKLADNHLRSIERKYEGRMNSPD